LEGPAEKGAVGAGLLGALAFEDVLGSFFWGADGFNAFNTFFPVVCALNPSSNFGVNNSLD
jgi:hypothetical protein